MRLVQGSMSQLEAYHRPTAEHCKRVGILAVRIGQYAELPLKPLFYGASLHDRGKLKVTRALLDKTGEWTAEDAQALRDHPSDGYEETLNEGMVVTAGLIVRHHSFQPNAYPEQLPDAPPYMAGSFEQCARMIALADYYDAAHRPNSAGLSTEEEIKAKLLAHQADMNELVNALYEEGILGTPR
ncbi:MAG: phosphohydrolase [Candidatus Saccharibacteria bacterium]|nr:phosphohydrolase [Candidatus Saccharibacteria bacterium]